MIGCVQFLIVALGLALAFQAPAQDSTASQGRRFAQMLGCWRMYGRYAEPAVAYMYWVPSVARLDSVSGKSPFPRRAEYRQLVRLDLNGSEMNPDRRPSSDWHVDSLSDSVYVSFSTGLSGTEFVFALPGTRLDTLVGRARGWGDVNNYTVDYGSATAVRVECPTPVANTTGWTPAQQELDFVRAADSTCATWAVAREQPVRGALIRTDSATGRQCLLRPHPGPIRIEGRWWCPGSVGYEMAFRDNLGKYNRMETRMDRRGIDESKCPGWHEEARVYLMVPPESPPGHGPP